MHLVLAVRSQNLYLTHFLQLATYGKISTSSPMTIWDISAPTNLMHPYMMLTIGRIWGATWKLHIFCLVLIVIVTNLLPCVPCIHSPFQTNGEIVLQWILLDPYHWMKDTTVYWLWLTDLALTSTLFQHSAISMLRPRFTVFQPLVLWEWSAIGYCVQLQQVICLQILARPEQADRCLVLLQLKNRFFRKLI